MRWFAYILIGIAAIHSASPKVHAQTVEVDHSEVFQNSEGRSFAVLSDPTPHLRWSLARSNAIHITYLGMTGDLARIDDSDTQALIRQRQSSKGISECWIGLQTLKQTLTETGQQPARWRWVDGTDVTWTNWRPGEPSGDAWEGVACYSSDGKWNDEGAYDWVHGYVIEFHPPNSPRVASASALVVNGFVVGVTVNVGGYGYTNSPSISFVGGGGSGATAVSQINTNGMVTEIFVTNPGRGYTNAPSVVIAPPPVPPVPPRQAVASAQVAGGFVVGVDVTDMGGGYTNIPVVTFLGGGGAGALATAVVSNTMVVAINIDNPGHGYSSTPSVAIDAPPFPPVAATVTAQVVNGFVVGFTVVDGGRGYTTNAAVKITNGGGSGATANATIVKGAVTAVSVVNPGARYTSSPDVAIEFGTPAPTPTMLSINNASSGGIVGVVGNQLVIGKTYQWQHSLDLHNWAESLPSFIANSAKATNVHFINTGARYFRLLSLP